MSTVTILMQQLILMILLAGVGYICFRTKKISVEGSKCLGNIMLYLSLPCAIINSFLEEYSTQRMIGLLYSAVAAAVLLLVAIVISRLFFPKDAILSFAASFSNAGFSGIPLIIATISEGAVFYAAAFIAFVSLLQWTYGVTLLAGKGVAKVSLKRVLTAPFMIAILVGMFFFLTRIPMPEILQRGVQYIAGLNTPLAMFNIGIYLAQTNLLKTFQKSRLYLLSAVRLLIIPLVSLPLLFLIPKEFAEMRMALLIVAGCPVGSNVAIYAQLYDKDYTYAVETVVITQILCVASIPLIVQIASMLHFV